MTRGKIRTLLARIARAAAPAPGAASRRWPFLLVVPVAAAACLWAWWASRRGGGDGSRVATPYRNARAGVNYVGDAACSRCHEGIAATYHAHPMGRSLATIAEASPVVRGEGASRELFEAQGYHYSIERRDGRTFHREERRDARGRAVGVAEGEVRYVLGSGTRGTAFLVDRDGYLFESPITWYAQGRRWDLSPGYAEKNAHFERPITAACLSCHANRAEHVPGTDNRYGTPAFRGLAIGCERCHGPGELHVRQPVVDAGEGPNIVNPRDLAPSLREDVCQQCHLIGVKNVERRGRELADYRPGLPLYEFESVLVRPPGTAGDHRNSGHVEQMHRSQCFRASGGALGCISCHDPHKLPAPAEKVTYYRDRCLTCHADRGCSLPADARRARSREDNCVECHMPRASTSDIPHLATTVHDIPRRRDDGDSPARAGDPLGPDGAGLVLFHRDLMSPAEREAAQRDVGVALCLMGKQGATAALPMLARALAADPGDVAAREAEGYALAALGRGAEGLAAFEAALGLDPRRESTLVGAGFLADRLGRRGPAIAYFERAVAVDPWRSDYYAAVALPLFEGGRQDEAAEACRRAIRINPANGQARVVLIRCLLRAGDMAQARAEFDALLAFDPPDREGLIRWFNSAR